MNTVYEAVNKVIEKRGRIKLLGDSITHGVGGTGFMQNGEGIAAGFKRNPDGYCWAGLMSDYLGEKYGASAID